MINTILLFQVAILVMPYSLVFEIYGNWKFGWIFCYFWISCDVTCCTASILHLCVISLDRHLAITEPLSYKSKMSKKRVIFIICSVWLTSIAISFVPIFLGWYADKNVVDLYVDTPKCGLYVNRVYAVISSGLSFYVPLLIMIFVYMKIYRIARAQAEAIHELEVHCVLPVSSPRLDSPLREDPGEEMTIKSQSKKVNRDVKAIRTLGTLMGLFCFCWLPFFLMYLILPFCSHCYLPPEVTSGVTWLGYTNSLINPMVYAFLNKDFRTAFKKLLTCGR